MIIIGNTLVQDFECSFSPADLQPCSWFEQAYNNLENEPPRAAQSMKSISVLVKQGDYQAASDYLVPESNQLHERIRNALRPWILAYGNTLPQLPQTIPQTDESNEGGQRRGRSRSRAASRKPSRGRSMSSLVGSEGVNRLESSAPESVPNSGSVSEASEDVDMEDATRGSRQISSGEDTGRMNETTPKAKGKGKAADRSGENLLVMPPSVTGERLLPLRFAMPSLI